MEAGTFQQYPEDEGWCDQLTGAEVPTAFTDLNDSLISRSLVCRIRGDVYLYSSASNHWEPLYSKEAMVQIVSIIQAKNVSVNYEKAVSPFINYLVKKATDADSYPTSICLGTWRLRPERPKEGDSGSLVLQPVTGLLPQVLDSDVRISGVCCRPLTFRKKPSSWSEAGCDIVRDHILRLFPNDKDMLCLQWIVGACLMDPVRRSTFVLLYGPGGNGKSTVIRALASTLRGASAAIPEQHITSKTSGLHSDVIEPIVSKRLLYCGDVDLKNHDLNLGFVRSATGQDTVSTPLGVTSVCCSVVLGSNSLPSYKVQKDWLTAAIMRRVIVLPMFVNAMSITAPELPDSEDAYITFALRCVHTKMAYEYPPISTVSVMMTLFGIEWGSYSHLFTIDDPPSSKDKEVAMIEAMGLLEALLSRSIGSIAELVSCISKSAVVHAYGVPCIRGLFCCVEFS
jgi:energy-coupling factor transporter ATP-binding protein EcfA2